MKQAFIIFAIDDKVACTKQTELGWKYEKIEGECWQSSNIPTLVNALQQRDIAFNTMDAFLVTSKSLTKDLPQAIQSLLDQGCESVQVLRWESLIRKAQLTETLSQDVTHEAQLLTQLCPLVEQSFLFSEQTLDEQRTRAVIAAEADIENLRQEAQRLLAEKAQLQLQIDALEGLDLVHLVTYMPLFFEKFFGKVALEDLALMSGNLPNIVLSSTYTEPDSATMAQLKRKFNALSEPLKAKIVRFAQEIPQRHQLIVRSSMQSLLEGEVS